jgi:two-component system nitrogen regulation response regulator GlnG
LQSVLKQAALQTSGEVLLPDFLPETVTSPAARSAVGGGAVVPSLDWDRFIAERLEAGSHDIYAECLALMERQLLTRMLAHTGGNQLRAAEQLGITRGSLRHKLRALGIFIERSVWSDDDQPD